MWEGGAEWKAYTFLSVLLLAGLVIIMLLRQESVNIQSNSFMKLSEQMQETQVQVQNMYREM
jgi:CO dehydrogenase/acetyl-CoA synthase delta subunit